MENIEEEGGQRMAINQKQYKLRNEDFCKGEVESKASEPQRCNRL